MLIAIDTLYEGSQASDTYLDYSEIAQQLLRQPARSLQLAAKEYDLKTDDETQPQLPPEQQTLSDAIEDLAKIPGIAADTAADLDAVDTQQVQNTVDAHLQQQLDDIVS